MHGYAVYSIHQTQRTRMIAEYERRMHNKKNKKNEKEDESCILSVCTGRGGQLRSALPGMKGLQVFQYFSILIN